MSEPKEKTSPIKKIKIAFSRSPKQSTTKVPNLTEDFLNAKDTSMEDAYFSNPESRDNLSSNPGEHSMHLEERKKCTLENWKAEIERRIVGESALIDYAYDASDPLRTQAYGQGDGKK